MNSEVFMNMKNLRRIKGLCLVFVYILLLSFCIGCNQQEITPLPTKDTTLNNNITITERIEGAENTNSEEYLENSSKDSEPKDYLVPNGMTIKERILTPNGYERLSVESGSFEEYLENFPLVEDGSPVLLYDDTKKRNQDAHIAVLDLPLVNGDLQQCADSVIRLYAQYFREMKQYDRMNFHFVSGFCCDYEHWMQGKRVRVNGNDVSWTDSEVTGDSQESFEQYLKTVFCYASTLSLEQESVEKDILSITAGDIIIKGGSPGHVVMVLDVCENTEGERAFLLGQGYMPAQQFHIIKNPLHEDDPWYYVSEVTEPFCTPEYTFENVTLRTPYE